MSKLTFLSFGKLKTPGLRETADYYLHRIETLTSGVRGAKRVTASELELKPMSVPDKSPATRRRIQAEEARVLLGQAALDDAVLVILDETGRSWTTDQWAKWIAEQTQTGKHLVFAIGSSLGFAPEVRKRAALTLSLGPQTLPHELARVVMIEQVYRALSIQAGHPYHNAGM
jgi:23S rRNA (pseudouridine1915-N3)-methyltransferase